FRLLGQVADSASQLHGLDAFVLPSLWEGLPLALLEAMAAGLPSIGTRVSGIEDVIEDGRSGWLVPPADPDALARALLEPANLPDGGRTIGAAGAARVATGFNSEEPARAYRQLSLDVVNARG